MPVRRFPNLLDVGRGVTPDLDVQHLLDGESLPTLTQAAAPRQALENTATTTPLPQHSFFLDKRAVGDIG
jgi:hypothetical protein